MASAAGACGPPEGEFFASAYIYNASRREMQFDVAHVPGLNCNNLDRFGPEALERDDFESLGLFRLGAHETMPLSTQLGTSGCDCPVFRVTSEGRSVVLRLPGSAISLPKRPVRNQVLEARGHIVFVQPDADPDPGNELQVLEVPFTAATSSCFPNPRVMTFKTRLPHIEAATIRSVKAIAGDCFEVTTEPSMLPATGMGGAGGMAATDSGAAGGAPGAGLAGQGGAAAESGLGGQAGASETTDSGPDGSDGTTTSSTGAAPVTTSGEERLYICAPSTLFPFTAGDTVRVSTMSTESPSESHTLDVSGVDDDQRSFRMLIGSNHPQMPPTTYRLSPSVTTCGPARDEERHPFIDVRVQHLQADGQPQLTPGKPVETELGARPIVLYLGRARHFLHRLSQSEDCEGSDWIELVESRL